jgi:excisionase family DNA binding protein
MEEQVIHPVQSKEAEVPVKRDGATYLRVSEAAERLGVHRNTVIYWIQQEQIKYGRLGRAEKSPYIIPVEEVERIIEDSKDGSG